MMENESVNFHVALLQEEAFFNLQLSVLNCFSCLLFNFYLFLLFDQMNNAPMHEELMYC